MTQKFSSANTSINKNKLPALAKKVNFSKFEGCKVLDYGCGKYDNFLQYLTSCNMTAFGYDKFNRDNIVNEKALSQQYDVITCNNVLNVIAENDVITSIVKHIRSLLVLNGTAFVTVYEGNKSGIGAISKADCFQRNEVTKRYIPILKQYFSNVEVKKNVLICK